MSGRYTRAQGGFTPGEEQDLFKTPPATSRRRQRSTEPGPSKRPSPGSPTPQSRLEPGPLDQSDSLSTSTFDDLDSQFSFEFTPKPKLKMAAQPGGPAGDPAGQGGESHTPNDQQTSESQIIDVDKQIELAKLRVQALQLELQTKRLAAGLDPSPDPPPQSSTPPVQFVRFDDRVNDYRKEVASKNPRLTFKLEGPQNYDAWREEAFAKTLTIRAKHILSNKELTCPADLTDDDRRIWQVKSEAVFDILFTMINTTIRHTIKGRIDVDQKNGAELWIALEAEYRIHAADTRFDLLRKFTTISIDAHNNDVQAYISEFRNICNKLKNMNYEMPSWAINDRFIDGLKTYYAAFIRMKRDEVRDPREKERIVEIDLEQLMDQLIARAMDHKKDRPKPNPKALKNEANTDPKPDGKDNSNPNPNPKRPRTDGKGKGKQDDWDKTKTCSYCHRVGHDLTTCKWKNWESQHEAWKKLHESEIQYWKGVNEAKDKAKGKVEKDGEEITYFNNPNKGLSAKALNAPCLTSNTRIIRDPDWYIDSGSSFHSTSNRSAFSTFLQLSEPETSVDANGNPIVYTGIGTIKLQVDDQVLTAQNARYSEDQAHNLISYGSLKRQGFKIENIEEDGLDIFKITDPQEQVFKALLSETNIYPLLGSISPIPPTSLAAPAKQVGPHEPKINYKNAETMEVWHRRLAHLNAQDIIRLSRDPRSGVVIKGPKELPFCEACTLAGSRTKVSRAPMPRSKRRGGMLHIDTGGGGYTLGEPDEEILSFSGTKYFLLITDDATRKRWVYFLKEKSDLFDVLTFFFNYLKNLGIQPSAVLRSDWAGEILSTRVQKLLKDNGTKWEPSAPHTQHQNGVSERGIQTICRRNRAVMIQAKLPKKAWAETMNSVVFLTDISPTSTELFSELIEPMKKIETPWEAWEGTPYNPQKNIREIGADAYVQMEGPELKKAGKLLPRRKRMTLIGFRDSVTYRLYDRETDSIVISCNVDINEKRDGIPPKEPSPTEMEDSLADQLSSELSAAIPAEIPPTSDPLAVGVAPAKPAPATLRRSPRRTVGAAPKNLDSPDPTNPAPQTVGVAPPAANQAPANSPDPQAVGVAQPARRPRGRPRKDNVAPIVQQAQKLTWMEPVLAYPENPYRQSTKLTRVLLAKQDEALFEDSDVYFRPFRQFKTFIAKPTAAPTITAGIRIPQTFEEAMNSPQADKWMGAMDKEMQQNHERNVYTLAPLPKGRTALGGKWVYTLKLDENGEIARYKARWVVKGFRQRKGVDYDQTYAPVVEGSTIRTLFAVAAAKDWFVKQIDFITAFLNGILPDDETVYMKQPTGYESKTSPHLVCQLNQGLYGLKQSAKIWYDTLTKLLKQLGFTPSQWDAGLWMHPEKKVYLTLYVDDVKLIGPDEQALDEVSRQIAEHFQITDLGQVHHYLGMKVEVDRQNQTICLSQKTYIKQLLEQFNMQNCSPASTPMVHGLQILDQPPEEYIEFTVDDYQSLIGSLQFLATYTRPDIAFATSFLARWNSKPTPQCWKAAKQILRYLRGTMDYGIIFDGSLGLQLVAYTDADWAGDKSDRKSTTGSLIKIAGGPVYWRSTKQTGVSLSTTEAEYIAASETSRKIISIRGILQELGMIDPDFTFPLLIDNNGAIAVSKGEKITRNARHIEIRYHHIRDLIEKGVIDVAHIPSAQMAADGFTKPLDAVKFGEFRDLIGIEDCE